jgi:hypothetical protein
LTDLLMAECRARGFAYRVLNAVSSITAVLSEVGIGVIPRDGVALYSIYSWEPSATIANPQAPTLFFDLYYLKAQDRLETFLRQLQKAYPDSHKVHLLSCPCEMKERGQRLETNLAGLRSFLQGMDEKTAQITTLFLPPLSHSGESADPQEGTFSRLENS